MPVEIVLQDRTQDRFSSSSSSTNQPLAHRHTMSCRQHLLTDLTIPGDQHDSFLSRIIAEDLCVVIAKLFFHLRYHTLI